MQLIELEPQGRIVFAGDTHGDIEASRYIIGKYFDANTRICFLGDYVDRGNASRENADYLLEQNKRNPEKIFLLQGNHEGKKYHYFEPCEFWDELSITEKREYEEKFSELPLALSIGSIIAVHAGIPNINTLSDFSKIINGDNKWDDTVWMDFLETKEQLYSHYRDKAALQSVFDYRMKKLNKTVLIRSHSPNTPISMYGGRCITIFTSLYYGKERMIAIADFSEKKEINSIEDLAIERF